VSLPSHLTVADGHQAILSPDRTPTTCDAAFCLFEFDLTGYDDTAEVHIVGATALGPSTGIWIGLARWQLDAWEWFAVPVNDDGCVVLDSLDPYIGAAGRALVAVVITGNVEYRLASLTIGSPLAPVAVLTAAPQTGDAPLTVTLDATGSYDLSGSIANYRWDLEDEGKFANLPSDSLLVRTFSTPGSHRIGLAVCSDRGYWGYTWITIQVTSDWDIERVDDYGYPGHYGSLVLDSAGRPHIASFAADWDNEIAGLHYAYYDGAEWQTEIIFLNEHIGEYTSLALDSGDLPHIACYDYTNERLMYVHRPAEEWEVEIVDDISRAGRLGTSIQIDNLDQPCISYYGEFALHFARRESSSWIRELVDDDGWPGTMSSLALDSTEQPHIAYRGSLGLRYAWHDGSGWHTEHVDESAGSTDREISLALDNADHPHIAYGDSNLGIFKYASYDGADWTLEVVDDSPDSGIDCSLALDALGFPHLAYTYFVEHEGDLKYASYDGETWQVEPIADVGSVGFTPSIALNNLDQPRLCFVDSTQKCLMYMWIGEH
jgi:hypothetical protein